MSLLAFNQKSKRWRTGLYRYASQLLEAFHTKKEFDLLFAHTANPVYLKYSELYLRKKGLNNKLCNRLANPFPRSLMGRGERYFNKMYRLMQIDVDKILYKDDILTFSNKSNHPNPVTK